MSLCTTKSHRTKPTYSAKGSQSYMQQHHPNMVCPKLYWRSTSGGVCSEVDREGFTTDDQRNRCNSSDNHTSVTQHLIHH